MARLTADGIRFSTGNALNSRRQIFALDTAWTFYQNTTPTGWTKVSDHNNKALRVVSGAGGGSGGTNSFTSTFSPKTIGGTINFSVGGGDYSLTSPQIAAHTHDNGGEIGLSGNPAAFNPDGAQTGWNGGNIARPPSGNNAWTRNSPGSGQINPVNPLGVGVGGAAHSHSAGTASVAAPNNTVTLDVRYIDIIVCTFNG
jgi:hypothetical protein